MTSRPPRTEETTPPGLVGGKSSVGRPARRQVGARLTADLYNRLREHSLLTNRSYPAILARAYEAHYEHLGPPPGNPFGYQEPTRLGRDSRLVQFYLDATQISLLQKLADDAGHSMAGTIRYLLDRYLTGSSLYEQAGVNRRASSRTRFLYVSDDEWATLLKRTRETEEVVTVQEEAGEAKIFNTSEFSFRVLDYTIRSGRGKLLSQEEAIALLSSAETFASPSGSKEAALENLLSDEGTASDPGRPGPRLARKGVV